MKVIEPIKNPKEDFGVQEWIGKPLPALGLKNLLINS